MALIAVLVLGRWNLSEYAITPANATQVAPLVKVQGLSTDPHADKIYLVDVYLSSVNVFEWIRLHFESHVQFVPADQLVDPGIPDSELDVQGYQEMSDSKQAAEVAAFRALGWKIKGGTSGATVTGVISPSPARSAGLNVADEIVAVNNKTVHSACGLESLVHADKPGTLLHLSVRRAKVSQSGVITLLGPSYLNLTTGQPPSGLGPSGCPGVGTSHSWIGVSIEDGMSYTLPAKVTIDTTNIGGPSAGLAMTLDLIDKLSKGSLTGHHVIAATGTMAPDGQVGDVGGVAEKTVAAQRAGATIFIVPQVEVATAKANASPGLRIVGVTTLKQALDVLRKIGGAAPVPLSAPH